MTVEAFDGIQIKTIQNVAFMVEHDFGADPKHKSFYPKYKVLKTPTRAKITRERRRIKAHERQVTTGKLERNNTWNRMQKSYSQAA